MEITTKYSKLLMYVRYIMKALSSKLSSKKKYDYICFVFFFFSSLFRLSYHKKISKAGGNLRQMKEAPVRAFNSWLELLEPKTKCLYLQIEQRESTNF